MGGKKKKGASAAAPGAAGPTWPAIPFDDFNDLDLRAHSVKLLDATQQLKHTAQSVSGLPPLAMFLSLLDSVQTIAVKARDGELSRLSQGINDIKSLLKDSAKKHNDDHRKLQQSLDIQATVPGAPSGRTFAAVVTGRRAESSLAPDWARRPHTNRLTSTGSLPAPVTPQPVAFQKELP